MNIQRVAPHTGWKVVSVRDKERGYGIYIFNAQRRAFSRDINVGERCEKESKS